MKISIIVAFSENNVIGLNEQMPWHLPADLKHFKKLTLGKPIIMGRKTFASIGSVLPGRTNIIVTRDQHYHVDDPIAIVTHSLADALKAAGDVDEVMIIGGANIYAQALPYANCVYLTRIHQTFQGDTFFPPIDWSDWVEVGREDCEADEKNSYNYSFIVLHRRTTKRMSMEAI